MNKHDTKQILRRLNTTYSKGIDLEFELRLQDEDERAAEVAKRNNALSREINKLRKLSWREWSGSATRLKKDISDKNRRLQSAIRDIEKQIQVAKRVVKALGYLDDVIAKAKGISA